MLWLKLPVRWLIVISIAALSISLFPNEADAQARAPVTLETWRPVAEYATPDPEDICVLDPVDENADTQVPARWPTRSKATKTATIEVEYAGFTPEARTAFERAVDIWERHIASDVTIKVQASFEALGAGVLGSAGPRLIWSATNDDGDRFIYGDALIDALIGENAVRTDSDSSNDDNPDIVARFSSDTNWYFGAAPPEGPGPNANQIDFTSVVLHELGHGLGFFGSMRVSDGLGSWGFSFAPGVPVVYDQFAVDERDRKLTNTIVFPNPSAELQQVLTGGQIFTNGIFATIGGEGERPQLYAPPAWDPGSSYSHLDEFTYPAGDPNSLMSPRFSRNELIHSPGAITCGMFSDMGWPLGPGCNALVSEVEVVGFTAEAQQDRSIGIRWTETPFADVTSYQVERRYFDGSFEVVDTVPSDGSREYRVELDPQDAGRYAFRLRWTRADGSTAVSDDLPGLTVQLDTDYRISNVYPNPFTDRANISVAVDQRQEVRIEVYNTLGQRVAVLFDGVRPGDDPRPFTFEARRLPNLPSGLYFFRVIGEDFALTRKAVRVR